MNECEHNSLAISCMESTYQQYDRKTQEWDEVEFTGHIEAISAECLECGKDVTDLLDTFDVKW